MKPSPQPDSVQNPLGDLLNDDLYEMMLTNDLINEKGLRDFLIRRAYQKMRDEFNLSRGEAIEYLQASYPYLQVDSIRKIVYRIHSNTSKKRLV